MSTISGALVGQLLLLCFSLIEATSQFPIVLSPDQFHAGTSASVGIYNPDGNSASPVTLSLVSGKDVLFIQTLAKSDVTEILDIPIPTNVSGSCTLILDGDGVSNSTDVQIVGAGDFFLVFEMDKKIYKAGQTVRTRVLGLKPDLTVAAQKAVTVEVLDPNDYIIQRSETVLDEYGVALVEMETSEEPVLGTWTLKAMETSGSVSATQTFVLDEYVLPKFEVEVEAAQSVVVRSSTEVSGTVHATYTYGEPVQGTVLLQVIQNDPSYAFYNDWGPRSAGALPPTQKSGKVLLEDKLPLEDGRLSFTFGKEALESVNWWGSGLTVAATVTEDATGALQNATAAIDVAQNRYTISVTGPATFKPGAPYTATVTGTDVLAAGSMTGSVQLKATLQTLGYRARDAYDTYTESVVLAAGRGQHSFDIPAENAECCQESDREGYRAESCCITGIQIEPLWVSVEPGTMEESLAKEVLYAELASATRSGTGELSVVEVLAEGPVAVFDVALSASRPPPAGALLHYVVLGKLGVAAAAAVPFSSSSTSSSSSSSSSAWHARVSVTPTVVMAPEASLVVYYVGPEGGLALKVLKFTPAVQLAHSVSAAFTTEEAAPGELVTVAASGGPSSRVYLLAVDKSVRLMAGGSTGLTASGLLEAAAAAFGPEERRRACWNLQEGDPAFEVLRAGALLLTPLPLAPCTADGMVWMARGGGNMEVAFMDRAMPVPKMAMMAEATSMAAASPASTGDLSPVRRTRKFFPEAWLWGHVDLGPSGAAQASFPAPDTITSWDMTAFGVSPELGVGVAAGPSALKVFKSFFVSAALPYAIVRGETVTVKVVVFNYLQWAVEVKLDLREVLEAPGPPLLELPGPARRTATAPAGSVVSVTFQVRGAGLGQALVGVTARAPAAVGEADAVQRPLLVRAEGRPRTRFATAVFSLPHGSPDITKMLQVDVPVTAVPGSARASLSAIGDLMGPSLSGLEHLIRMPTGCGEQNMIGTAPNVFVSQYLAGAGKLAREPTLAERARKHMLAGWQRELTYMHPDKSFSAFGTSDKDGGSTWLTAFVVKTFSQAREFVYIDPAALDGSVRWLEGCQGKDGSFASRGRMIHTEMQGGAASGAALTAFVLVSLLEAYRAPGGGVTVTPTVVSRAVEYIVGELVLMQGGRKADQYAATLAAYAVSLACASMRQGCDAVPGAVEALKAAAIAEAGSLHWENAAVEATRLYKGRAGGRAPDPRLQEPLWCPEPKARSTDVEMTAYGLLALVEADDLGESFPVARWLLEQRSDSGGFSSTQDTVVGLQALAAYAGSVYSDDTRITLHVAADDRDVAEILVDGANLDILQQQDVAPGAAVAVRAAGSGLALLQLSLTFHELQDPTPPAYDLAVAWRNLTARGEQMRAEVCVRRLAPALAGPAPPDPGMTVVEVGIFSGFAVDRAALREVAGQGLVKRADVADDGSAVHMYLDSVGVDESLCSHLTVLREVEVAHLQPAMSSAYAYYHPELNTLVASEYHGVGMDAGEWQAKVVAAAPKGPPSSKDDNATENDPTPSAATLAPSSEIVSSSVDDGGNNESESDSDSDSDKALARRHSPPRLAAILVLIVLLVGN